ncbi:MAG: four helix bundle protein [Geoalkalibacter sp.]|jgi:four helix bundle protein|uniref:four helix bundle protein n=1 Tax=Geoalkalibacter sp. TaxID=3041440 RepID=UPI002A9F9E5B|nr:four helix bundle protein [Thermodesulfobacteriota bacterium]
MEGCDGGKVNSHCDLIAWKLGIEFVTDIYQSTQTFPKHEIYGLTSQMRRAAVSVPSNVAEGAGRRSRADFRRFLNVALGSLAELETQIIISSNLGYLEVQKKEEFFGKTVRIRKMIFGLINKLGRELCE